jgi:hypothetical protein
MGLWIKNSDGKPDATFTMAVIAFAIVTIKILLAGITIAFMGNEYSMGSLGADVRHVRGATVHGEEIREARQLGPYSSGRGS